MRLQGTLLFLALAAGACDNASAPLHGAVCAARDSASLFAACDPASPISGFVCTLAPVIGASIQYLPLNCECQQPKPDEPDSCVPGNALYAPARLRRRLLHPRRVYAER